MRNKNVLNAHGVHVNIHVGDKVVYDHLGGLERGHVSSFGAKNGEVVIHMDNDSKWAYGSQVQTVISYA